MENRMRERGQASVWPLFCCSSPERLPTPQKAHAAEPVRVS
ncbi:hypothetical protein ACJ7K1_02380 [Paenibacillus elgii]